MSTVRRLIAGTALALALVASSTATTEAAPRPYLSGQDRLNLCNWIRPYGQGTTTRVVQWLPDHIRCWVFGGIAPCIRYDTYFENGQWTGHRNLVEVHYSECQV